MNNFLNKIIFTLLTIFCALNLALASEGEEHSEKKEDFNPGEMITHHIGDSHEWEFAHGIAIPLPVILYVPGEGIKCFSSSNFHNKKHEYEGFHLSHEDHKIHALNANGEVDHHKKFYDISITKNVASLLISAALLLVVFFSVAKGYAKNKGKAPKGIQSFFEPIIIFVKDDVAKGIIGPKYERFLPYLLTVFFFIWFNNILGLLPGGANLTGNIAVTMVLALMTFLITTFSGNKSYWGHIFNTPGVPMALKPIIIPIEIIGMFTKPFSLMVRLFANITAGHIIILSLFSLIFILKAGAIVISIPFAIFMSFLELFVALLQAYIFTLLSAMYFAAAVEEHHHDEHHHNHDEELKAPIV